MSESVAKDPFYLDGDELRKLCEEREFRLGLAAFKEHRVVEVARDGDTLDGAVEDAESLVLMQARVVADAAGQLTFSCDCSDSGGPLCHHLVAVLQAYADRRAGSCGLAPGLPLLIPPAPIFHGTTG